MNAIIRLVLDERHAPSEIGNAFGDYDCTCGEPYTGHHETSTAGRRWRVHDGVRARWRDR